MQFKVYVRDQNVKTFQPAPNSYHLKVIDPTDKVVYEKKDISLNEFGAFHGEFKTGVASPMGWYQFVLTTQFKQDPQHTFYPMRVLVTDFTPSVFKVSSEVNGGKV